MIEQTYRSYQIEANADRDPATGCWIPRAVISSETTKGNMRQPLMGPTAVFKAKDAAETYALQIAKWSIDDQIVARARKTDKVTA